MAVMEGVFHLRTEQNSGCLISRDRGSQEGWMEGMNRGQEKECRLCGEREREIKGEGSGGGRAQGNYTFPGQQGRKRQCTQDPVKAAGCCHRVGLHSPSSF